MKTFKELTEKEITIFCDMDGVLTNFMDGVKKYTGSLKQDDIERFLLDDIGTSKEWWASLDPMPDAMLLWKYITKYEVQVLSACPGICKDDRAVMAGKKAWVKKHLRPSPSKVNIVQRRDKKNFARPNNVLIDDHKKNVKEWKSAGGIGILHKSTISTIKHLKDLAQINLWRIT